MASEPLSSIQYRSTGVTDIEVCESLCKFTKTSQQIMFHVLIFHNLALPCSSMHTFNTFFPYRDQLFYIYGTEHFVSRESIQELLGTVSPLPEFTPPRSPATPIAAVGTDPSSSSSPGKQQAEEKPEDGGDSVADASLRELVPEPSPRHITMSLSKSAQLLEEKNDGEPMFDSSRAMSDEQEDGGEGEADAPSEGEEDVSSEGEEEYTSEGEAD